ncbi:alpha/beta hydrolase [Gordonia sp. (in: high G+C Gram-positive bacteria)]|uniref:esterase/lipase family protein n=1 Tax=Gordonia sp. (in: high G+C Gram-positive bacteria) TaxID=84139 RepID=UPI003C7620A2
MHGLTRSDPRASAPKPGLVLTSTDFSRSLWELAGYAWTWPAMATAPVSSDSQPVLVLPGLATSDLTTAPLRATLANLGYPTYGWKSGVNLGPTTRILDGMRARINEVYRRHGQPVSLIGWSLGGIFARELARETPEMVRQVITLGSPFRMQTHNQSRAKPVYQLLTPLHARRLETPLEADAEPLSMPTTSFYSRLDGVVAWQACRDDPSNLHENIEVLSSHLGFGHNLAAVWGIADRLALPSATPAPFRPPSWLRHAFPQHRE